MKTILFSLLLLCSISSVAQVLSKTSIIFESKNIVMTNSGKEYKVVEKIPLYAVTDTTIPLRYTFNDKTLILNRVLVVKGKGKQKKLIEWIKGKMVFYEFRED